MDTQDRELLSGARDQALEAIREEGRKVLASIHKQQQSTLVGPDDRKGRVVPPGKACNVGDLVVLTEGIFRVASCSHGCAGCGLFQQPACQRHYNGEWPCCNEDIRADRTGVLFERVRGTVFVQLEKE